MKFTNVQFYFLDGVFDVVTYLLLVSRAVEALVRRCVNELCRCVMRRVTCTRVSLQMLPQAASTAATRERVASDSWSMDLAAAAAASFAREISDRRLLTTAATSLSDRLSSCCTSC